MLLILEEMLNLNNHLNHKAALTLKKAGAVVQTMIL